MVEVLVCGAAGRMGTRIVSLVSQDPEVKLVGAVESKGHPAVGRDAGEVAGVGNLGVPISDDLAAAISPAGAVIDFTVAHAAMENIRGAAEHGKAMVIGTTGFSPEQREEITRLGKKIPIFIAPNMSLGINLMFKIIKDVAAILGDDYDVEIVEAHHRFKKDAPSGTALRMGEILAEALSRDLKEAGVYGRHGMTGERKREEIGIMSLRMGDVVGDHTVIFGGMGERLEITHRSQSRDNFARGAIRAAKWIVNQGSGTYDMWDLLGFTP